MDFKEILKQTFVMLDVCDRAKCKDTSFGEKKSVLLLSNNNQHIARNIPTRMWMYLGGTV